MERVVDKSLGSMLLTNEIVYAELCLRESEQHISNDTSHDEDYEPKASNEIADKLIARSRPRIYGETLNPEYLSIHLLLCAMIMQALDDYIIKCENLKCRQTPEERYRDLIGKANIEWFFYNSNFSNFILHNPTKLLKRVRQEFTYPHLMETYFHRESITFDEWLLRVKKTNIQSEKVVQKKESVDKV